jgi:hypothetical protein
MESCNIQKWKNELKTKEFAENQRRLYLIDFNVTLRKLTKNKKKDMTDKLNKHLDDIMDNVNNIEQYLISTE